MKRKETSQLKEKNKEELKKMLADARGRLVKLKVEKGSGKLKDIHAMAKTRGDIARIMTIIRQQQEAV